MRWFFLALLVVAACNGAGLKEASAVPTTDPTGEDRDPNAPDDGDDAGSASTLPMTRKVTVQVQPSDGGAAILAAIRDAKKSVHMTMYLLTDSAVVDALGDVHDAGREVKVVLNREFPPNGGDNQPKYDALSARGIAVEWASTDFTFTHAKTIVIDGAKAIIMTMNLTQSSARTNREYIATDTDADDVADLEKIFAADFAHRPVEVSSKLVVSPKGGNDRFSARDHLRAFIGSAKESLDVEVQTLSDTGILDAILKAHAAKVAVRVVVDGSNSDNSSAQVRALDKLKAEGVPLRAVHSPDIHAKTIVVDGRRAFIGSQNTTATALDQNREIGVLTDAAREAAKVREVIAADFEAGTAR